MPRSPPAKTRASKAFALTISERTTGISRGGLVPSSRASATLVRFAHGPLARFGGSKLGRMALPDGIRTDVASAVGDPLEATPPSLSLEKAQSVAERVFGIVGISSRLHSERDANFRIDAVDASF